MSKRAKLLDAMHNNPRDWRIEDLLVVAKQFDIECRNSGGSHHVFGYPGVVAGCDGSCTSPHQADLYPPIPVAG